MILWKVPTRLNGTDYIDVLHLSFTKQISFTNQVGDSLEEVNETTYKIHFKDGDYGSFYKTLKITKF